MKYFDNADSRTLAVNQTEKLSRDIQNSKTLLYIGDNCGEVGDGKIFVSEIKDAIRIRTRERGAAALK